MHGGGGLPLAPEGEELVHGHQHDGDPDEEVGGQLVAEERVRHERREDGGQGGGVLLEDGVGVLEEEGGEDPLGGVVGDEQVGEGALACGVFIIIIILDL